MSNKSDTPSERINWQSLTDSQVENKVDIGLRHKRVRATPADYLKHFLSISRQFAFATHDDSWGEFEKEFAIIIRMDDDVISALRVIDAALASARHAMGGEVDEMAWEILKEFRHSSSYISEEDELRKLNTILAKYVGASK